MLNKVMVIGNIGSIKVHANTANKIMNFSVACNEKWRDKQTGETQTKTVWVNCTAFGKWAEIIEQYASKGALIYVEGKLDEQEYVDKNQQPRKITQVVVNNCRILGGKKEHTPQQKQPTFNTPSFNDDVPF